MRDDRARWDQSSDTFDPVEAKGLRIEPVSLARQTMISAPGIAAGAIGWGDLVTGQSYRIAMRRDRVLEIQGDARAEGWTDGLAVSNMTDGYAVFDIIGNDALALMQRGTEITQTASRSASRQLWGHTVLLYMHEDALRLHVLRGEAHAVHANLCAALSVMG